MPSRSTNELTEDQMKVLDLYDRGFSYDAMADILHLTKVAIKKNLDSISKK